MEDLLVTISFAIMGVSVGDREEEEEDVFPLVGGGWNFSSLLLGLLLSSFIVCLSCLLFKDR